MRPPPRLIARIDLKGHDLIKSVKFEGVRKLGRPAEFVSRYYAEGVDEIILVDAVASLYRRPADFEFLKELVRDVYIPVTFAGGLRTLEDMDRAFRSGADKIAINTAALEKPGLVTEAVKRFGSQCVIGSVVAKCTGPGRWEPRTNNARERVDRDAFEWMKELEGMGVGEILLSSVDNDGMRKGFEMPLVERAAALLNVPLIVCGGAGSALHVKTVLANRRVDAVAIASALHYRAESVSGLKGALVQ